MKNFESPSQHQLNTTIAQLEGANRRADLADLKAQRLEQEVLTLHRDLRQFGVTDNRTSQHYPSSEGHYDPTGNLQGNPLTSASIFPREDPLDDQAYLKRFHDLVSLPLHLLSYYLYNSL